MIQVWSYFVVIVVIVVVVAVVDYSTLRECEWHEKKRPCIQKGSMDNESRERQRPKTDKSQIKRKKA